MYERQSPKCFYRAGFTLIELAVVLVIIGLLTGSVVVGKSMIEASRVRAVISDFDYYKAATKNFQDKYLALPGDMTNATAYWGTASGGCPTPGTGTGTQTCNGDGNEKIGSAGLEQLTFWKHLANAKFINGTYTGAVDTSISPTNPYHSILNSPASSLKGAIFSVMFQDNLTATTTTSIDSLFAGSYGNVFIVRKYGTNSFTGFMSVNQPALAPAQMLDMDSKMDDGFPGTGVLRSVTSSSTFLSNCVTTNDPTTAVYKTSIKSLACIAIFVTGF